MNLNLKTYAKARQNAVAFDRSACLKIMVSGADHETFLNNILSQNMLGMKTAEWRETTLLSATSHVLAYMYAVKLENSILLISAPETSAKIYALLEKFLITEDVQIRDAQADWNFFEVWGPQAEALIKKNAPFAATYKPEGKTGPRILVLEKLSAKIFENELLGEADVREVLRIENAILEFGIDFDETHMLSETRLEKKAASETKGCYPGQEVVAKIETYKRLNRSFCQFFASGVTPQPADGKLARENLIYDVKSGGEIGRLTSQAYSPFYKKTVGLGWLKRGFFEQPGEVLIGSQTPIPAAVELLKN